MEIPEIQKIINQKAEKRAKKEVQALISFIRSNQNLRELLSYKVEWNNKTTNMKNALRDIDYDIPKDLVKKLTEKYIPEETKIFVNKIEEFERQLDELKNSYEND